MRTILPKSLLNLANACPAPLYVVGGCVRDFLANMHTLDPTLDFDICAPIAVDEFVSIAKDCRFTVRAVYKNTGTVKLMDEDKTEFEFTCFRSDKYVRGVHTPTETHFTNDIVLDAKRRDFTANAVYYDIRDDRFIDPLGGIPAIREKRLSTVADATKVFGEDGLRLMRLCRQAATLGFTPDTACINGAQAGAALIEDISKERIYTELTAILTADTKYGVADGHYQGLKLLHKIGVLQKILPELTLGEGMLQRPDFHDHDVLEHSLRAARYAPVNVRLAALLHDIGKPFCMQRDGNGFSHPQEGERIVRDVLNRLKAPKKVVDETALLTKLHMYDFNGMVGEKKLRRFLVTHYAIMDKLLAVKQADFSACKDNFSAAPTCVRWRALLAVMQEEGVPTSLKQLAINGNDVLALAIPPHRVATVLHQLLMHVAVCPKDNQKQRLCKLAIAFDNGYQED